MKKILGVSLLAFSIFTRLCMAGEGTNVGIQRAPGKVECNDEVKICSYIAENITGRELIAKLNANLFPGSILSPSEGYITSDGIKKINFYINNDVLRIKFIAVIPLMDALEDFDPSDLVLLTTDIFSLTDKLTPLSYDDFIKGKRSFGLSTGQNYRFYRISNSDDEEIFKMLIEKSNNSQLVEFYILGQKFLRMNFDYQENSTKLTLTFLGYKAKYVRPYSSWSFDNSFDPFTNTVISTKGSLLQFSFLDTLGTPISQNEFSTRFDQKVTSNSLAKIRKIFEYHNYYFPSTMTVQTGLVNERLKAELSIALNRLQNNTEINLVKKQIQDYIDAAANGLLVDTRPKQ